MGSELKPCPFCGVDMEMRNDTYPNRDQRINPYGWHNDNCPLNHVLWCFDVEDDEWTEEAVAKSWNMRADD